MKNVNSISPNPNSNSCRKRNSSESTNMFHNHQNTKIRPWYSTFTGCCIVGKKWKKVLVHLQCGEQIVVEGTCIVKPVVGSVDILGYRLDTGEKNPLFSPKHHALLALSCGVHALSKVVPNCKTCGCVTVTDEAEKLQETHFLSDQQVASLYLRAGCRGVVLELQSFLTPLRNVLLHCGVPSLYMDQLPLDKDRQHFTKVTNNSDFETAAAFHCPLDNERGNASDLPKKDESEKSPPNPKAENDSDLIHQESTAEHVTLFKIDSDASSSNGKRVSPMRSCDVNQCFLALNGAKFILASMPPSIIVNIPNSWNENVDDIIRRVQTGELNWAYRHRERPCFLPGLRIMVVGSMSVGKSTFVRYLVNALLNFAKSKINPDDGSAENVNDKKRKRSDDDIPSKRCQNNTKQTSTHTSEEEVCITKSVCLLDLDCGQPEISIPGSISLRSISEPLLGPALVNGSSRLKSDSEMAASLRKLRTRNAYLNQLKNKFYPHSHSSEKQRSDPNDTGSKHASFQTDKMPAPTPEELSMLQEVQEMVEELESETIISESRNLSKEMLIGSNTPIFRLPEFLAAVEELKESIEKNHAREPLVVNTMGWTRNEGLILLAEIMKIVQPVIVLHVVTGGDDNLTPKFLEKFHNSEAYLKMCKSNRFLPVSYVYKFEYMYFQVHSGKEIRQPPRNEPGVLKPSRFDLRQLNVIAYFSSLWSSSFMHNFKSSLRPCKILRFDTVGLYSLERVDDLIKCPGSEISFELVSLCRVHEKNLVKVADDLPLQYQNEKDADPAQANVRAYPVGFNLLNKYCRYPLPGNYRVKPLPKLTVPCPMKHYRTKMKRSLLSTYQFPVLGWGILASVDRAARTLKVFTPMSENCFEKVNLVVRSQLQLPDALQLIVISSSR